MPTPYIGRFAPSPTGPMHFGTLIAAVASYLQARARGGRWLVRMEDVDVLRKVAGADSEIMATLEAFGFAWDGDVLYQTTRDEAYADALQQLKDCDLVFPCTCSRKQLAAESGEWSPVYPGTCRQRRDWDGDDYAIRILARDEAILFDDRHYGSQQQNVADCVGDFVIRRRDGLFAYQLAVVVDDAFQDVTEVVRGTDLIDSTARQIYLQRVLGYPTPGYFHFPIAVDDTGSKLSKSSNSAAIDAGRPVDTLNRALAFLGQSTIACDDLDDFWQQAIAQWDTARIPRSQQTVV